MRSTTQRSPLGRYLHCLERHAIGDFRFCKIVLGVYDLVLGSTRPIGTGPEYEVHVGIINGLPAAARRAAHSVLEWGAQRGIVLNELLASRHRIRDELQRLWVKSAYGRRRRTIAADLRRQHPPRKPEATDRSERVELLEVLHGQVGRPLGPETIRQINAFHPAHIEVRGSGEPWYSGVTSEAAYVQLGADGFSVESIHFGLVCEHTKGARTIHGVLDDYFETGTEGLVWSVIDDDARGYDGLHPIEEGDHLTITDQLGRRLWSGKIACNRRAGWRRYPMNPKYGQPCALGYWVHWTQKGFTPNKWARFFIRPAHDRLRGILKKRAQPQSNPSHDLV